MTTFRVGDKVRLVGGWWNGQEGFTEGSICTITGTSICTITGTSSSPDSLRLQFEGDDYFWYITNEFAVELVDETPVSPTLEQRVLRLEELLRTLYPGVEL